MTCYHYSNPFRSATVINVDHTVGPYKTYTDKFPDSNIFEFDVSKHCNLATITSDVPTYYTGGLIKLVTMMVLAGRTNVTDYHVTLSPDTNVEPMHKTTTHLSFAVCCETRDGPNENQMDSVIGLAYSIRNQLERIPPHCQKCYENTHVIMTTSKSCGTHKIQLCGQVFTDYGFLAETQFDIIRKLTFNLACVFDNIKNQATPRVYPEQSIFLTPRLGSVPRTMSFYNPNIDDDGDLSHGLPIKEYYY